ncbi:MAG TPA: DUF3352 domain-containing protein [Actinopolymorphaceae bacterium]
MSHNRTPYDPQRPGYSAPSGPAGPGGPPPYGPTPTPRRDGPAYGQPAYGQQPGPYAQQSPSAQQGGLGQPGPHGQGTGSQAFGPYGQAPQGGPYGQHHAGQPSGQPGGQWGAGGGASYDVLESEERRGPRWMMVALAALLVLVVGGGGGAFAYNVLSGRGTQPEDVLPGNAINYVRFDLDPAGDQKVALLNLARKFPELRERLGQGDDLRKSLFEALQKEDDDLSDVVYETDIEPWLGDRLGVAQVPGTDGGDTETVVALQIKGDEETVRKALDKMGSEDDETGYAFTDDYLIIAETQSLADRFAQAGAESSLASNQRFADDMDALGQPGILSFWADLAKAAKSRQGVTLPEVPVGPAEVTGRLVGALSFETNAVQLKAVVRGVEDVPQVNGSVRLGELPSSTIAALSVAGAGQAFEQQWPQLRKMIESTGMISEFDSSLRAIESQFGITIPGDIVTLLGEELTIAVDERGLSDAMLAGSETGTPPSQPPLVGIRSTTDVKKAEGVLGKLQELVAATGAPITLATATGSDSAVIATTQEYAKELVRGGDLGSNEAFQAAVVDVDKAHFAMFADLDKLEKLYGQAVPPERMENLEPLRAVGMSGTTTADGGTFTVRVLVN